MKKVAENKTLCYNVAFVFCTNTNCTFMMGKKLYRHINTVYDRMEKGTLTIEVAYCYNTNKYESILVDGNNGLKEITIVNL